MRWSGRRRAIDSHLWGRRVSGHIFERALYDFRILRHPGQQARTSYRVSQIQREHLAAPKLGHCHLALVHSPVAAFSILGLFFDAAIIAAVAAVTAWRTGSMLMRA